MKVAFKTNLDNYQTNCFPSNLDYPPRIGETVVVNEAFLSYYRDKKLPMSLEVVNVSWTERGVICELWYSKQSVEMAKACGIELF